MFAYRTRPARHWTLRATLRATTSAAASSIPLPVLGNTLNLSNTTTMPQFLAACRRQYGPVFTLSAPGMRITALVGPEANVFASREGHRVLRSREAWRPNDRELGTETSMISEDGEIHRAFRWVQGRPFNRSQCAATLPLSRAVVAEDLAPLRAGDSYGFKLSPGDVRAQFCAERMKKIRF